MGVDVHALRQAPARAVAAALDEVASLGTFFRIELGGPDPGWRPVDDTYADGYADLVAAVCARHDTGEARIGASIAQLGHAARLWSPVLACTVAHGIVPDLEGLLRAVDGPALRLPAAPTGWYADGVAEQTEALYAVVVTRRLDALAAGLRTSVAPRLLAGNTASALAEAGRAVLAARPDLTGPVTGLVDGLLNTGLLIGSGKITGPSLAFRRRSCCLYYRVPQGEKCGDCVLAR
ncbi:(2Fe-2S)-binding protein [Streptomyces sp. NPDC058953]|uniref:(2Fe-2S)-binding protein n=1 Tax=unclassified Streptomyces TaxID=2593676 RepID=UPI0036995789